MTRTDFSGPLEGHTRLTGRHPSSRQVFAVIAATALAVASAMVTATSADSADHEPEVVYSSELADSALSSPSLGYSATRTVEFGDRIALAGEARQLDAITVGMNSWACETGSWNNNDCETTTPGASYEHPVTVNVYAVDDSGAVPQPGATLATITQDVNVPFRPSADSVDCDGKKWFDSATDACNNGFAFDVDFDFSGADVVLPDEVIVAIAYPTQHTDDWGPGPYDSLNVGLSGTAASVGNDVDPDTLMWHTTVGSYYSDGGDGGTETLRQTSGWGDPYYTPVLTVTAVPEPRTESVSLGDAELTFDGLLCDVPSADLILSSEYTADPGEFGLVPPDTQMSFGAYSYELNVCEASTVTVTMETPTPANTLFKFMDGEWTEYPAEFSGTTITFELTDGGAGDLDGEVNGVIVDPAAPGLQANFTG